MQAAGGALWWVGVFASSDIRRWTLGGWNVGLIVGPDVILFIGGSAIAALTGHRLVAAGVAVWTCAVTAALTIYGLVTRLAGWGVAAMTLATVGSIAATAVLWLGKLPIERFFVGPFAFRVAHNAARHTHLRRSLLQLAVFWTTFFVLVPTLLIAVEQRLRLDWPALDHHRYRVVGLVVFLSASAVGLWACASIALHGEGIPLPAQTARQLVIVGPYRYVRNPMAVAGALQTGAVGLWAGSWTVTAIALIGAVAWDTFIRPDEEADLAARFGTSYDQYRTRVRCWIPISTTKSPPRGHPDDPPTSSQAGVRDRRLERSVGPSKRSGKHIPRISAGAGRSATSSASQRRRRSLRPGPRDDLSRTPCPPTRPRTDAPRQLHQDAHTNGHRSQPLAPRQTVRSAS